jgi:hypothetical protein
MSNFNMGGSSVSPDSHSGGDVVRSLGLNSIRESLSGGSSESPPEPDPSGGIVTAAMHTESHASDEPLSGSLDMVSDPRVRDKFEHRIKELAYDSDVNPYSAYGTLPRSEGSPEGRMRMRDGTILRPDQEDVGLGSIVAEFLEEGSVEAATVVVETLRRFSRNGEVTGVRGRFSESHEGVQVMRGIRDAVERFVEGANTLAKMQSIAFLREHAAALDAELKDPTLFDRARQFGAAASAIVGGVMMTFPIGISDHRPVAEALLSHGLTSLQHPLISEWWVKAGLLISDMLEAQMEEEERTREYLSQPNRIRTG